MLTSLRDLRKELDIRLDDAGRAWLDQALTDTSALETHFAAARRRCGREAALAARVLLLASAWGTDQPGAPDTDTLTRLYQRGTTPERLAVLHALPHLALGPAALPLVEDALRTNDTRLVAAALGPYGAAHLPAHAWRQAVLKCLFTGVPLSAVHHLSQRARGDAELARMLTDYARERTAAGRPVPDDLHRALDLTDTAAPLPEEP